MFKKLFKKKEKAAAVPAVVSATYDAKVKASAAKIPEPARREQVAQRIGSHSQSVMQTRNLPHADDKLFVYDPLHYDSPKNPSQTHDVNFNVFQQPHGITVTSSRFIIKRIAQEFKDRCTKLEDSKHALDMFKPNLSHFERGDYARAKSLIRRLYPWRGACLNGPALNQEIRSFTFLDLILTLRIIFATLPEGLFPWSFFQRFVDLDSSQGFKDLAFRANLPKVLPKDDYIVCITEFLEILLCVVKTTDLVVDHQSHMDMIFIAGQVCFKKSEDLVRSLMDSQKDLIMLGRIYYKRGYAMHQLFVSYLRALNAEEQLDFYLKDKFELDSYPPKQYSPHCQKALALSVPTFLEENNFNELFRAAVFADSRIYSSTSTFTKLENKFLDKMEENPHKIMVNFFSKSSKSYLSKFDAKFDVDSFKDAKKGESHADNDQYAMATWINNFKSQGFNIGEEGVDTLHFNFDSTQAKDKMVMPPVCVSKIPLSEWFILSWKYEMFQNLVMNTVLVKLTKRIGDCDWLIVTTDERMGIPLPAKQEPVYEPLPSSTSKVGLQYASMQEEKRQPLPSFKTPEKPLPQPQVSDHERKTPGKESEPRRPPPPLLLGENSTSPLLNSSPESDADSTSLISKEDSAYSNHPMTPTRKRNMFNEFSVPPMVPTKDQHPSLVGAVPEDTVSESNTGTYTGILDDYGSEEEDSEDLQPPNSALDQYASSPTSSVGASFHCTPPMQQTEFNRFGHDKVAKGYIDTEERGGLGSRKGSKGTLFANLRVK